MPTNFGPDVIARSISVNAMPDKFGNRWQYHSRSDHHSKVACLTIVIDLMRSCESLRRHVANREVFIGINHEMQDFTNARKKFLDLVICTRGGGPNGSLPHDLTGLARRIGLVLNDEQTRELEALPPLFRVEAGSVRIALEAKAAMTAHQRALPRLYDELNSSQLTVHGDTNEAIAAGFVMINAADSFISPDLNKRNIALGTPHVSAHRQPRAAELVVAKVRQLPRRSSASGAGFDALGAMIIDCRNDGSRVEAVSTAPAPRPGDILHYDKMIDRIGEWYQTRFGR